MLYFYDLRKLGSLESNQARFTLAPFDREPPPERAAKERRGLRRGEAGEERLPPARAEGPLSPPAPRGAPAPAAIGPRPPPVPAPDWPRSAAARGRGASGGRRQAVGGARSPRTGCCRRGRPGAPRRSRPPPGRGAGAAAAPQPRAPKRRGACGPWDGGCRVVFLECRSRAVSRNLYPCSKVRAKTTRRGERVSRSTEGTESFSVEVGFLTASHCKHATERC